jgi:uncharacterized protein (DUF1778 family)
VLLEEAVVKGAASVLSGTIGAFVLAGNRRRAANVFLASFMFLLAGNQFAETMRVLAETPGQRSLWFRVASVFAFLDPLALYAFGSVFPERNRLNHPLGLGAVLVFSTGLAMIAPFLELGWRSSPVTGPVLAVWATGTVVVYGAVLWQALSRARQGPADSASAVLLPALCVITFPALVRAFDVVPVAFGPRTLTADVVAAVVLFVAPAVLLRKARSCGPSTRRLLVLGAIAGLAFGFIGNPGPILRIGEATGLLSPPALPRLYGAGTALKLLTFGVVASAAILRHRMLDLSLSVRRWAARLLAGSLVVGGLTAIAELASTMGGPSLLAEPGLMALFLVVLVATEGFRRLVDLLAETAYGVPRESRRVDRIETYHAAVQQAREEGRPLGSDPRLRRLREELNLGEHTVSVVERMHEEGTGGPLVPGETLQGRYRIESFLGRGGSGRAFRARDELLDRDVAIKEVLDGGPHETARALREARNAGQLDHPNVVTVHDVLQRPGASLLVTEFADHGSLADRLEEDGPFGPQRALAVLDGILSGLEAVHAEGIVHGDLKPSNVLLHEGGVPKITDFGASRSEGGGTRSADEVTPEGTPAYMASEQRRGEQPTERSDVYAVGVMAEEIWRGPLPETMRAVLRQAQATDPADRFASVTELRAALREAAPARVTSGR